MILRVLSTSLVALTLASRQVPAQGRVGPSDCNADTALNARVQTALLDLVPQRTATAAVVAADSALCRRAVVAWPRDSTLKNTRPFVFLIEGSSSARFAIVYANPGYPKQTEWLWSACFFDREWKGINPCVVF